MKFSVERDAMNEAMAAVIGSCEKTTRLPILSHVLLEIVGQTLTIRGCNLTIYASKTIPISRSRIDRSHSKAAVLGHVLAAILKHAPPGCAITVEGDDEPKFHNSITIRHGKSKFNINALSPDDFPARRDIDGTVVTLDSKELAKALTAAAPSASIATASRMVICGVHIEPDIAGDGSPVMLAVATDGYRLLRTQVPCVGNAADGITIPTKSALEIARVAKDCAGDARVFYDKGLVEVSFSNGSAISSKLIDINYPDWRRLVDIGLKDATNSVTFSKSFMLAAMGRIADIYGDDRHVDIKILTDQLDVFGASDAIGKAHETFEAELDGQSETIGFNAKYLLEIIREIDDEKILMRFVAAHSAVIFTAATTESSRLGLVMPQSGKKKIPS